MVIGKHHALKAYIKIALRHISSAHMAAAGMLGRVTMHFKNHNYPVMMKILLYAVILPWQSISPAAAIS